jgi:hypothetical protein
VPVEVPAEEEPEEAPVPELPDEAEDEPEPVAPVLVVEVAVVDELTVGGALFVGTVRVGAPVVLATVEPPPQAETPTASAKPADRAAIELAMRARRDVTTPALAPEGVHSPPAMWAIVQVLLRELVAPIAEAEVLDAPGELRSGGGEGEEHGHGLELLARLPIQVGTAGYGLDHHLTSRRGRPQAVFLINPHRFDATSGAQTRHHRRSLG